MSLEELCIKQEEQIQQQSAIIQDLLNQLYQFRELFEIEAKMAEDDNK